MKQAIAIAIFATSWLGGLTTAEGCWFRRMFGGGSQTTYMLPVAAAPAPVAPAYTANYPPAWQQVMYAPQTQYQTMWRPYPITTYSPVAANGLVPSASYGWQANRVPVVSYQPVLPAAPATTVVPAAPLPAASVAPSLAPSCNCAGSDTTSYYGSTSAWSPVSTGYSASSPAATVAGYAPSTMTNYTSASDWTPVTQSDAASYASSYAPPSTTASTTLKPWQVSPNESSIEGATPWMTLEEFRRQQEAATEQDNNPSPAAADEPPTLLPQASTGRIPQLDNDRFAQWKTYDDESGQHGDVRSSSSTQANVRYLPPKKEKQQLIPFNRPIPDPDREGNGWDFDDKLQLQHRESRSARATTRWRAIPVRTVSLPSAPSSELDQLLEPPRRPEARKQGGWKSH